MCMIIEGPEVLKVNVHVTVSGKFPLTVRGPKVSVKPICSPLCTLYTLM